MIEPWRVGLLFSSTGHTARIEKTQLDATLLAIKEINTAGGVLNRPIVPIVYNPDSQPELYGHYAAQLMKKHGINCIFGCYISSGRQAVLPVVERLNGLLFYPTLYEGFEFSPNVIYTGASPNQNSGILCSYLMKNYGRSFYFVGSDYVYARQSNRLMKEYLRKDRGFVVGERYFALDASRRSFDDVLTDIMVTKPDVIFSTVVGHSTSFLYQAYAKHGLDPLKIPIASLTTSETEVVDMGAEVGANHITAACYFQTVNSKNNRKFIASYRKEYGPESETNFCAEAAYFQMHLFAKALINSGTMMTEKLRSSILDTDVDAPQGKVSINRESGHADLWSRIGKINDKGQFDIVFESSLQVKADPYLIAYGSNAIDVFTTKES